MGSCGCQVEAALGSLVPSCDLAACLLGWVGGAYLSPTLVFVPWVGGRLPNLFCWSSIPPFLSQVAAGRASALVRRQGHLLML